MAEWDTRNEGVTRDKGTTRETRVKRDKRDTTDIIYSRDTWNTRVQGVQGVQRITLVNTTFLAH